MVASLEVEEQHVVSVAHLWELPVEEFVVAVDLFLEELIRHLLQRTSISLEALVAEVLELLVLLWLQGCDRLGSRQHPSLLVPPSLLLPLSQASVPASLVPLAKIFVPALAIPKMVAVQREDLAL